MPDNTQEQIAAAVAKLRERAAESQADAAKNLNPLFTRDGRDTAPRDFVESSFLFMRSCDADAGSRPIPCPVFWLSPDLLVAPTTSLWTPTSELTAGQTYRVSATVRNRGDLPVPSAKVEFYLVNPSLGFDTRVATKLGVTAGRVQSHGATVLSMDYTVPPSLGGHRCLFARVFAFSPLDVPIGDYALDPRIDRHVAQRNLSIVAPASKLSIDWIHRRNAAERLEVVPMTEAMIRAIRAESISALTFDAEMPWREVARQIEFDVAPGKGPTIETSRTDTGLELVSADREAVSLERQTTLTTQVLAAVQAMEKGRASATKYTKVFRQYRAMAAEVVRTQVTVLLPPLDLEPGQAMALNVIRRSMKTGDALGGIALVMTGTPR
jgi:hypothetical protein